MPSIDLSTPVTVFHYEIITCRTDTVPLVFGAITPGGLELLIPDIFMLETPSESAYPATWDDQNFAWEKVLPGVIVTQSGGSCWKIAASCESEQVNICTVHEGLFPSLSTDSALR